MGGWPCHPHMVRPFHHDRRRLFPDVANANRFELPGTRLRLRSDLGVDHFIRLSHARLSPLDHMSLMQARSEIQSLESPARDPVPIGKADDLAGDIPS